MEINAGFFERIRKLEKYFLGGIKENNLFEPEYIAAKQINELIQDKPVNQIDLQKVIDIFNETNTKDHYNGTGWLELKIHLQALLSNMNVEWENGEKGNIEIK